MSPTLTGALFYVFLTLGLLLYVYFCSLIFAGLYFLCCCNKRNEKVEKRTPVPIPATQAAHTATSPQIDTGRSKKDAEKVTTHQRQRLYPDLEGLKEEHNVETQSIPYRGRAAIFTIENEQSEDDYSQKRLYPTIAVGNIKSGSSKVLQSQSKTTKTEETSKPKNTPTLPVPAPGKAILTIENENYQKRSCTTASIELKKIKPNLSNVLQSSTKATTKANTKKSKLILPRSTKAKHLDPKCFSANQACQ